MLYSENRDVLRNCIIGTERFYLNVPFYSREILHQKKTSNM